MTPEAFDDLKNILIPMSFTQAQYVELIVLLSTRPIVEEVPPVDPEPEVPAE